MINIKNLSYAYNNDLVLSDVSFDVKKGEFVGIIGPNGGGKSTLLNLILNKLSPKSGTIELLSNKISYVAQYSKVNDSFPISVFDLVLTGILTKKSTFFYKKEEKQKALKALELTNMLAFKDELYKNLSGGQKQRVLISRALISECDILLLDEPTASIDINGQMQIFELLKNLKNISILCVCHDIALISSYANKIIHIQKNAYIHEDLTAFKKDKIKSMLKANSHICPIDLVGKCKCF